VAERAEPGTLARCRARVPDTGRRGRRAAAKALGLATGRAESALESLAWVLWHVACLPTPLFQAVVLCGGRFLGRVDFLWPEAMLVVEVDGLGKYAERGELQREKARQNALVAEGYTVLRFTWADVVHRPDAVLRQVRASLMINT
jgi:very-short-patch-repair endonuclease